MGIKKLPVILEQYEVEKLLDQPSKTSITGKRNFAAMKTMLNLGLRVSEITNLKTAEIDLTNGKLRIVQGKGNKDRNLKIPPITAEILKDWQKKSPQSEYFFPTLKGTQLKTRYLQQAIKRYTCAAKLTKRVTPHTLRHVYATEFYKQTKDIEKLRRILGHENIGTTTIYITLANTEIEQAMETFKEF